MKQPRKQRIPLNLEKVCTIQRLKQANQSTRFIAKTLNLSIPTITKVVQKIHICEEAGLGLETICKKSGPKPIQIDSAANISLTEIVQEDPTLTQKGMKAKLNESGICFSIPKICRTLKILSITRKRIKKRSSKTVTNELINQRKVYARDMRLYPNARLLFLDESGFNLHCGIHYGYSAVNTNAYQVVPCNRGRNISLISLLSCNQITNFKLIDGAYNTEKLKEFLEESWASQSLQQNDILVMDNVRFHHSNIVKNWCEQKHLIIKYLPPYSPDLNPIENVFSTIKSRYSAMRPFPTTSAMIKDYVGKVISNMNADPEIVFERYFEQMREYLTKAFNGDHF